MPEFINYDGEIEIVRINSVGKSYIGEWKKSLNEVIRIRSERRIYGVLVDSRKQKETSGLNSILEFSKVMPKDLPFALLLSDVSSTESREQPTEPKQRFLEAAASSEGVKIKSFIDEDEAVRWLLHQDLIS